MTPRQHAIAFDIQTPALMADEIVSGLSTDSIDAILCDCAIVFRIKDSFGSGASHVFGVESPMRIVTRQIDCRHHTLTHILSPIHWSYSEF